MTPGDLRDDAERLLAGVAINLPEEDGGDPLVVHAIVAQQAAAMLCAAEVCERLDRIIGLLEPNSDVPGALEEKVESLCGCATFWPRQLIIEILSREAKGKTEYRNLEARVNCLETQEMSHLLAKLQGERETDAPEPSSGSGTPPPETGSIWMIQKDKAGEVIGLVEEVGEERRFYAIDKGRESWETSAAEGWDPIRGFDLSTGDWIAACSPGDRIEVRRGEKCWRIRLEDGGEASEVRLSECQAAALARIVETWNAKNRPQRPAEGWDPPLDPGKTALDGANFGMDADGRWRIAFRGRRVTLPLDTAEAISALLKDE